MGFRIQISRQVQSHTPIIPAALETKPGGHKFESNWYNLERPCLKIAKKGLRTQVRVMTLSSATEQKRKGKRGEERGRGKKGVPSNGTHRNEFGFFLKLSHCDKFITLLISKVILFGLISCDLVLYLWFQPVANQKYLKRKLHCYINPIVVAVYEHVQLLSCGYSLNNTM